MTINFKIKKFVNALNEINMEKNEWKEFIEEKKHFKVFPNKF